VLAGTAARQRPGRRANALCAQVALGGEHHLDVGLFEQSEVCLH
jgi:hypothetical protein